MSSSDSNAKQIPTKLNLIETTDEAVVPEEPDADLVQQEEGVLPEIEEIHQEDDTKDEDLSPTFRTLAAELTEDLLVDSVRDEPSVSDAYHYSIKTRPSLSRASTLRLGDKRKSFVIRMSEATLTQKLRLSKKGKGDQSEKHDTLGSFRKRDPYHDFYESGTKRISPATPAWKSSASGTDIDSNGQEETINVPTLVQCAKEFHNAEAQRYNKKAARPQHRTANTLANIVAACYIFLVSTAGIEAFVVGSYSVLVAYFYCDRAKDYAVKLDFAFLAFAVVFPLTFLIQQSFTRREQALMRLADFRSSLLSTALATLTMDWPPPGQSSTLTGGRLGLPERFNQAIVSDCKQLLQLVYEYLSMPAVSHARHIVFAYKHKKTKRVHALQNEIIKQINDVMYDFAMHTEEMRKHGFPSGEASRLHQYHQYLTQRFEHLRYLKYYRTPQATRSFGRVYLFILPWLAGPYFAWVYQEQNVGLTFALLLACFTFLMLLGLLNTQQALEDPFWSDLTSFTPGIDAVKLDFEFAVASQAIEQYLAQAEAQKTMDKIQLSRANTTES